MNKTEKLSKFWTDSVAYVALILGAGVSIAGNVADTFRTRGQDTDSLDIFLAAFWPAVVVLTVHLFVNARWIGLGWAMQTLRWVGTLGIGGMAMRVSWVHLNDLMASRGQKADVAILGPLAIDGLAIMATALILAGRTMAKTVAKVEDITVDTRAELARTYATVADEASDYLSRLASHPELDSTTTPAVPVVMAKAEPLPRRTRAKLDTDEMLELARVGRAHGLATGEIAALLAGWYEVSSRTIRRTPGWTLASA